MICTLHYTLSGYRAHEENEKYLYICFGKPEGKRPLENMGVDDIIILKWVLETLVWRVWI